MSSTLTTVYHTASTASQAIALELYQDLTALGITTQMQLINQKINQKWLKTVDNGQLLVSDIGELSLIANGMKVSPHWLGEQQRIVKAGKKSELLLKAAKLSADMQIIDATAGFGHDSLILASTGAHVTMLEQNPLMYSLLKHELQTLSSHPHWQKLLSRLTLKFVDATQYFTKISDTSRVERIYLDPMFPQQSYKSAQVGKMMQVLHTLARPPTLPQEQQLLLMAKQCLTPHGRVIVKRPKQAPYLANIIPDDSVSNDLVRFDSYLTVS